jgi:hypothetical protein
LAKEINEPVDKIINWFKHERRKYLNTGTIETYKVCKKKLTEIYNFPRKGRFSPKRRNRS